MAGAPSFVRKSALDMTHGYLCEDCETAIWPASTRSELQWLKDRAHIAREVAKHSQTGLDSWIADGLAFLDRHEGHSVILVTRR